MREKRILLIVAVAILSTALTATATANADVCGDADGNGIVNVSDAVYLISYIFGGGSEPECGIGPSGIGTVTDIDGNLYYTVKIGDQQWMLENLRVTHYRNGDPIPNVTDSSTWESLTTGARCNYDNDEGLAATYGRLYNWYAVDDSRNIAPEGWHVPTDDEWKQLEMHLGMNQAEADGVAYRGTDEGGKLKEAGTVHWAIPNEGATNESGFTALPGGVRLIGRFQGAGFAALFWCSTDDSGDFAYLRTLEFLNSTVFRGGSSKRSGLSIRCVRDQ
jgi:uncharacterized protein (TIGR02145 family)